MFISCLKHLGAFLPCLLLRSPMTSCFGCAQQPTFSPGASLALMRDGVAEELGTGGNCLQGCDRDIADGEEVLLS